MRTLLLKLSLMLTMLSALTTFSSGQVQDHLPLRVTIPFDFIAGDVALPAGEYKVSAYLTDREVISGKNGRVVIIAPAVLEGTAGNRGLLIFHQIGDEYFLSEVWPAGSTMGRMIGGTNTLRRQMNAGLNSHVTVIAGGTR